MATSKIVIPKLETAVTQISTGSWTCSGFSSTGITATGTKPGWYPLGVVGTTPANERSHYLYRWELTASSGTATVTARVQNLQSSAITDTQFFDILWVKEA